MGKENTVNFWSSGFWFLPMKEIKNIFSRDSGSFCFRQIFFTGGSVIPGFNCIYIEGGSGGRYFRGQVRGVLFLIGLVCLGKNMD